MPLGLLVILTFVVMGMKRGIDFPIAALAAAVGDRSNGTLIEGPVDMISQFVDIVWGAVIQMWNSTPKPVSGTGIVHVAQMAQTLGIIR